MARNWKPASDEAFALQNAAAVREAREAGSVEPRAERAWYDAARGLVQVKLRSGFVFGFAPEAVEGLAGAGRELSAPRISPSGDGLHWDDLDVHVSLTGLMAEALNLREWAPRYLGGLKSEAKAAAARRNGAKGGRPRGSVRPAAGRVHAA